MVVGVRLDDEFAREMRAQTGLEQVARWHTALVLFSAAAFGLALGMVRERSQSLFPAIIFHIIAAAAAVIILMFF